MFAIVKNGVVENVIVLSRERAWRFPDAVEIPEFLPVAIGDTWDGEKFLRNGEAILNPLEQASSAFFRVVGSDLNYEDADIFRSKLESMAQDKLDDKEASDAVDFFPCMRYNGAAIQAGTRIRWGDVVKRAAVTLWDTEQNNPDNAPSLWEDIEYRQGIRIIPETITAGKAFGLNEKGWWGDDLYMSLLAVNVWTPSANPSGWELISEGGD